MHDYDYDDDDNVVHDMKQAGIDYEPGTQHHEVSLLMRAELLTSAWPYVSTEKTRGGMSGGSTSLPSRA